MKHLLKSTIVQAFLLSVVFSFSSSEGLFSGINVNGEVMRVSSDSGEVIKRVTLLGGTGKTYGFSRCGSDICEYNIAHVDKDCYNVVVITDKGAFLDEICIQN